MFAFFYAGLPTGLTYLNTKVWLENTDHVIHEKPKDFFSGYTYPIIY